MPYFPILRINTLDFDTIFEFTLNRLLIFLKEMEGFTDFLAYMRMRHHKLIMIMTLAQDPSSLHQTTPVLQD